MTKSAGQQLTAQQSRKVQEAFNVQRLTTWVGASALSLSGIFTAFAAKSAPMTIGVTPAANLRPQASIQNQVNGALDDRIVVRRVYLPPPPPVRPPTGGVRAGQPAATAAAATAAAGRPAAVVATTVVASAAAPAPPPKPVAATGGSTPRH
jgi:hypothetical protein